jgi:hypothetical protein
MNIEPGLLTWLNEPEEPSLRYRIETELLGRDENDPEVARIRSEIGSKGWAAEILSRQFPDGHWVTPGTTGPELYRPKYIATNWQLIVLSDLGLSSSNPQGRKSVELTWDREGGREGGLGGERSEVCYTGNAVRYLSRLGDADDARLDGPIDWLIQAQKADGGWHCWESSVGSLDCWEALAAFAVLPPGRRTAAVRRAIERGAEFYLERELLHAGGPPYPPWSRLHYPNHYYYDVLVGLDVLTRLGYGRDSRLGSSLELVESKRNPNGSWNLEAVQPDIAEGGEYSTRPPLFPYCLEMPYQPSRWITITALSVLGRAGRL